MTTTPQPPKPDRRWYQISRRTKLMVLVLLTAMGIGIPLLSFYNEKQASRDKEALWWVATIVVDHMNRNDGLWPDDWTDLEESYEIHAASRKSAARVSFDELRSRVAIDFDANPSELAKVNGAGDEPPFGVIHLKSAKRHASQGKLPNRMILEYLVQRAQRHESYVYPKRPHPDEKEARTALLAQGAMWRLNKNGRVVRVMMASKENADAVVKHLESLRELRELDLGDTNITDDDLQHIRGLTKLEFVVLERTQVTGAGLVLLARLTNLTVLGLDGTQVTDAGLKHLKGLTKLQHLGLRDTKVTDAGLAHLAGLTDLQYLILDGNNVTDAGLMNLKPLGTLEYLSLDNTQVTDEGVEKLQQTLTNCEIDW